MPRKQTELDAHLADLRQLYGDNLSLFSSRHHARYHDPTVPYHVIARVFQGLCLLTPSPKINDVINGVIGRAQELWPNVQLYAHAFLSNHVLCAAAHKMCYPPRSVMRSDGGSRRLAGDTGSTGCT